jgi:hypothetical protein
MKTIVFYVAILIASLFTACSSDSKDPDIKSSIVGKYWCPEIAGLTTYYFKSDGTYEQALATDKTNPIASGTWTLSGTTMKLIDKSGTGTNQTIDFKNVTSTSATFGTAFGDLGYKVCP